MSNSELENFRRILETISLGEDIPAYANDAYQNILSTRNMVLQSNVAEKYNRTGFNRIPLRRLLTKMSDSIRSLFGDKWRSNLESRASRYPLVLIDTANKIYDLLPTYADAVQNKYKGISIYKYIISEIEKAEGAFMSRNEEVAESFTKAEELLSKNTKNMDESLMKINFAFLQIQSWANPGNRKVKSGVVSFSENANNPDSPYSDKMKKKYNEFLNKYKDYSFIRSEGKLIILDGNGRNVTTEYFSKAEMDAYKTIRKELDKQKKRAEETSLFNNKNAMPFVNEYFPENNFSKKASAQSITEDPLVRNFSNTPSVKSKNLLEKTAEAHPVMHNPFAVSLISINGTEMQYQLLNPIQIARKTINKIIDDNNISIKNSTGKEKERYNELGKVYSNIEGSIETLVEHLKGANINNKPTALDNISDILTNTFYVGALASVVRTTSDLVLNYQHLITSEPSSVSKGFKEREKIKDVVNKSASKDADKVYRKILGYIGASQINRVMGVVNLTSVRSEFQSEGANKNITRRGVESDISKSFKKVTGVFSPITKRVNTLNEALMSVSDNMPALNFFIGSFSKEFKEATGNDFDWDKAAKNDADYMLENSDAINYASMIANYKLAVNLGSKNISSKPPVIVSAGRGQTGTTDVGRLWTRTRYIFRQFTMGSTAQFLSSLGNLFEAEKLGDISKQGRIMTGSALRTSLYSAITTSALGAIWSFFAGDDEDEDIVRDNSDDLSNDDKFIKKLFTITDKYPDFEEEWKTINKEDVVAVRDFTDRLNDVKEELRGLLKDQRFRDLFNANYRFFAREMFSKKINAIASNVSNMNKYEKSNIDNILSKIKNKDVIGQDVLEENLGFLNSKRGRSLMTKEFRENAIEKIEKYLVDTKYYLLWSDFANTDEFDPTTAEGSFKTAALYLTAENLLKHRDISFASSFERGVVETVANVATGVRGNFEVKATSFLIELLNKKYKEEKRGYYDFDKDRYSYSTPDIMLSDKELNPGKIITESLTPPEVTLLLRGFQNNRVTDAMLMLRVPGVSDLNRIGGTIKKDEVYQNTRGKFVDNELKQFIERKLSLTEKEKEEKAKREAEYNSKLVQDKRKIRRVTE
jgi:hypothetical protein